MPIEDLKEETRDDKPVPLKKDVLGESITIIAGFAVRNPLFDCTLQLIGFVSEMDLPRNNELVVFRGMKFGGEKEKYYSPIYPKVVRDLEQNPHKKYMDVKPDEFDVYRNYYLYDKITDKYSNRTAEEIVAVCKYKENGIIKHDFFNLHEITLDK